MPPSESYDSVYNLAIRLTLSRLQVPNLILVFLSNNAKLLSHSPLLAKFV
jgi:hypothetical protein